MSYVRFYLTYLPAPKSDILYGRSLRLPGREKLPKVKEEWYMFIRKSRVTCHVNVHHVSALHSFYNTLCTDTQYYVCWSGGTFALVESLVQSHLCKFCITLFFLGNKKSAVFLYLTKEQLLRPRNGKSYLWRLPCSLECAISNSNIERVFYSGCHGWATFFTQSLTPW